MARLDRSAPVQGGGPDRRGDRPRVPARAAGGGGADAAASPGCALAELVAAELVSRARHAARRGLHLQARAGAGRGLPEPAQEQAAAAARPHRRRPGAAFPRHGEAQPELLARHFAEAGLPARAIGYWRQAGERALARSGTKEALAHLASGLAALEGLPQDAERQRLEVELRLALGQTLRAAKGTAAPETEAAFRRAREVCEQSGDDAGLAQALHGLALCHYNRADLGVAHATGSEFLALAERAGDPDALRKAHQTLGYISFALGHLAAARSHLEKAAALAHTLRHEVDPDPQPMDRQVPSTLVYLAWSLFILGYPDQASRCCRRGLDLAARSPDPFAAAMAIGNAATFYQLRRDAASARREAERLIALARAKGIPFWISVGDVLTRLGAQRGRASGCRSRRDAASGRRDAIRRPPSSRCRTIWRCRPRLAAEPAGPTRGWRC